MQANIRNRTTGPRRSQRGFSLIETLIALGILGMVGTAFMAALVVGGRSTRILDDQVKAEALARSQLEAIKNATYNTALTCYALNNCYPVTITVPPGYTVTVTTAAVASPVGDPTGLCDLQVNCLQKVTVQVLRPGATGLTLIVYKKCLLVLPALCQT